VHRPRVFSPKLSPHGRSGYLSGLVPVDPSPEARPPHGALATAPSGGTSRAVKDFGAAVARGSLSMALWFFIGGLGRHGEPIYARRQLGAFVMVRIFLVGVAVVLFRWGQQEPAMALTAVIAFLSVGLLAFTARSYAKDALLLAATRDTSASKPLSVATVSAPRWFATRHLQALALGVDRLRRGDASAALAAISEIEPARLEADEHRMLLAVQALAARQAGDGKSAALKALAAFPTGALPIDGELGRVCIDGAYHDGARLGALVGAWTRGGHVSVTDDTELGKSLRFALVKLERLDPTALREDERAELAERARALGDLELARRISAAAPPSNAYR
jgi:hypothetical protein